MPAGIIETRMLVLDWPARVRLGDVAEIILTVSAVDVSDTLLIGNMNGLDLSVLVDAYAIYSIIAEAKLEIPGSVIRPPGVISQPIRPGQAIIFSWQVLPEGTGQYAGTAWFSLRFFPKEQGESSDLLTNRYYVAAMPLRFEVQSLAGISGELARILGGLGILLGLLTALPSILERLARIK